MKPAIELAAKINAHAITLGVLVTDHVWPRLVEVCKQTGLDYMIVDCEHGPHNDETVAAVCDMGRVLDFPVLMRVISTEYDVIRRALDLGPCGLMFPAVESTEQLDQVAEAVRMPPRGRRRPGGLGNSWVSNVQYPTWVSELEDHLIVLPQIETRRGLANVEAIAAHAITTAIAVGPYDLSAELGCCWQPEDERLQNALRDIRNAGTAAGKNMWMIGDGPTLRQRGYTFLCVGDPSGLMAQRMGQIVSACRD